MLDIANYRKCKGNLPFVTVDDIKVSLFFSHIFGYIHTVFLFIALGHSCINPFIYFWTDARVRWGFLDLFGSIPGVKKCFPNISWESPLTRLALLSPKLTTTHCQYPGKEQPATTTCQDRTPELLTQSTGEGYLSGRGTRRLTRGVLAGDASVLTF